MVAALSRVMTVGKWLFFDLMMALSMGNALLVLIVDGISSVQVNIKLC